MNPRPARRGAPRLRPLARTQHLRPQEARLRRRDALVEAHRHQAGRRHRQATGCSSPISPTASFREVRNSHNQNIILADVEQGELLRPLPRRTHELLSSTSTSACRIDNIICCLASVTSPLANAKPIPIAEAIQRRFDNLNYLFDIGDIDLHLRLHERLRPSPCRPHRHPRGRQESAWSSTRSPRRQPGAARRQPRADPRPVLRPGADGRRDLNKIIQVYVEAGPRKNPSSDTFRRIGIDPRSHEP